MIRRTMIIAAALAAITACSDDPSGVAVPQEGHPSYSLESSAVSRQLAAIRAATARYQDVAAAVRDGFQPVSGCVSHPQLGGMGIHYARLDRMVDADHVATEPEMLLYVPDPAGRMTLLGVEYWITEAAWLAAGRTGEPALAGQPFDYSVAGHGMPARYTLHVWTWRPNPAGMFAPFNPRVTCPDDEEARR